MSGPLFKPLRHLPDSPLDEGIIGPRWLTREELAAQPERWRSELVLRCIAAAISSWV